VLNQLGLEYFEELAEQIQIAYNTSGNPEQNTKILLMQSRNCQSFKKIKIFVNNYMIKVNKVGSQTRITNGSLQLFNHIIEESKGMVVIQYKNLFENI